MKQYAVKLMFQWRPVRHGVPRRRRVCEERILLLSASSEKRAIQKAKKLGAAAQFVHPAYGREEGEVHFDFVGIRALMQVDPEEDGVVWYDLFEMLEPMERRDELIPTDEELVSAGRLQRSRRKLPAW